jgi:hypothetical protein
MPGETAVQRDSLQSDSNDRPIAIQQKEREPYYNTPGWSSRQRDRAGRLSHGCIAWLIGLPLPIVILAFLWRGCD